MLKEKENYLFSLSVEPNPPVPRVVSVKSSTTSPSSSAYKHSSALPKCVPKENFKYLTSAIIVYL